MDTKPIIVAYSGSLDAFSGIKKQAFLQKLLQWFWTYKHDTVDASTRSAYYLIKAVERLKNEYHVKPDKIQFQFWGHIHPLNRTQAQNAGVSDYFEFDGYLPKSESLKRLNQADLLFLPLEKSNTKGNGTLFIPGKLYEYLNASKPILGLCESSDCRTILESSGLGLCVEPDDPSKIAKLLFDLVQQPSRLQSITPDKAYIAQFDFKVKTQELAKVFDALIVK